MSARKRGKQMKRVKTHRLGYPNADRETVTSIEGCSSGSGDDQAAHRHSDQIHPGSFLNEHEKGYRKHN
jgi:hypothetical protein